MDVVYPLKLNGECEELRYSLRSLKNLEHDNVFIVGDKPDWATDVEYLETIQLDGKYKNLCTNIEMACKTPEISDPFIIFNDDFFVMKHVGQVTPMWRETIPESLERYRRRSMIEWLAHMMRLQRDADATISYELHVPMVVHKDPMLEALAVGKYGPCWRTAYGAVANIGGVKTPDVKVMNTRDGVPPGRFASCSDKAFQVGQVGKRVKQAFPDKSEYERD